MEEELKKAKELKGSKLTKNEKFLVENFWNDDDFELRYYKNNNSIGYHKIN
jgi:hypothetical protein